MKTLTVVVAPVNHQWLVIELLFFAVMVEDVVVFWAVVLAKEEDLEVTILFGGTAVLLLGECPGGAPGLDEGKVEPSGPNLMLLYVTEALVSSPSITIGTLEDQEGTLTRGTGKRRYNGRPNVYSPRTSRAGASSDARL